MLNIAVLVSGGGTNLQALIDAEKRGVFQNGKITCVISSKPGAYALTRAKENNIESVVVSKKELKKDFDDILLQELRNREIGLVVLAGFLCILGNKVIETYSGRIINVHPSLIPSFCGDGYYGLRVHQAALDYGVKVTGATVHLVNNIVDGGKILLQKAVEIKDGDTAETLQKRVMEEAEWELLPRAVAMFCEENTSERNV